VARFALRWNCSVEFNENQHITLHAASCVASPFIVWSAAGFSHFTFLSREKHEQKEIQCLLNSCPSYQSMKGEWRYSSTRSHPRHWMAVICRLHVLPRFPVDSEVGGLYTVGLNVMAKENPFPCLEWNPGRQALDSHFTCFSIKLIYVTFSAAHTLIIRGTLW
jgi:hypothetical protein